MPPNIEDLVSELPVMKRRFALRPLDWILIVDFMMLLVPLAVTLNSVLLNDDENMQRPLVWSSLLAMLFAAWLGKRQKTPLPPASDNVLRRAIALSLLGVGAAITLIGAVIFAFVTVNWILDNRGAPWFMVPLSALPLLLGHALMFGGATIRVVPGRS